MKVRIPPSKALLSLLALSGCPLLAQTNHSDIEPLLEPAATSPFGLAAHLQWGDFDADGLDDVLAITPGGELKLLRNAGDGSFSDTTVTVGLDRIERAAFATWIDYDRDGQLDLFVGTLRASRHLLQNQGGTFVDVTATSGIAATGTDRAAYWLDYDADGRLDLHLVGAQANTLFHALPDGGFEPVELPTVAGAPTLPSGGTASGGTASAGRVRISGEAGTERGPLSEKDRGPSDRAGPRSSGGGASGSGGSQNLSGPGLISSAPGNPVSNILECVNSLQDANGGGCISASSTATLGMLYPLSDKFFVDEGTGHVGIGTTTPGYALEVEGQIISGLSNDAPGIRAAIGGGWANLASGDQSAIGGGAANVASGDDSMIGGGTSNNATGKYSTIGGGAANAASADSAVVPGGTFNTAAGGGSMAAGTFAAAIHKGSFVWGDSTGNSKSSSANDQFNVYAEGGVRMFAEGTATPSMVIDGAGHVGIGTATPAANSGLLVVTPGETFGLLHSDGNVQVGTYVADGSVCPEGAHFGTTTNHPLSFVTNNTCNKMLLDVDGNLGIGTDQPAAKLHISEVDLGWIPTAATLAVEAANATISLLGSSGSQILLREPDGNGGLTDSWTIGRDSNSSGSDLKFRYFNGSSTTQFMTIDSSSGSVGIGTDTPARKLHVKNGSGGTTPTTNSSLVVESSTEASISMISPVTAESALFFGNSASGANAGAIVFNPLGGVMNNGLVLRTNDTNRLAITAGGDVGVGTLTPTFKLEVNGSAGKPGGGTWSVSSDRRLKKNIQALDGALETLLELRGVTFEYKDPEAIHELAGERLGFIAQEVEEVMPDWVEEIDGYKRLTIRGFEALAVEAIRELEAKNAELEARVARLEAVEADLASVQALLATLVEQR